MNELDIALDIARTTLAELHRRGVAVVMVLAVEDTQQRGSLMSCDIDSARQLLEELLGQLDDVQIH